MNRLGRIEKKSENDTPFSQVFVKTAEKLTRKFDTKVGSSQQIHLLTLNAASAVLSYPEQMQGRVTVIHKESRVLTNLIGGKISPLGPLTAKLISIVETRL